MNPGARLSVETVTQLAIFLANRPGALTRVCAALAQADIIEYLYLAGSPKAERGLIILRPSDVEKAQRVLRDL